MTQSDPSGVTRLPSDSSTTFAWLFLDFVALLTARLDTIQTNQTVLSPCPNKFSFHFTKLVKGGTSYILHDYTALLISRLVSVSVFFSTGCMYSFYNYL